MTTPALSLSLGYWTPTDPDPVASTIALARAADEAGYSCAWVAEAYGSDTPTVLAWLAGQTRQIGLGAAVMQIPGRSAAMTAMTAATLDRLSGGRFRLGLGVSGPQVSEGWHGVPFARPLGRTREYVEVVRMALAGRTVAHRGEHLVLPLEGGAGKPLRLMVRPTGQIPLYLAAVGPKNLELAGQIADGVLVVLCPPEHVAEVREALDRGAAARPSAGDDAAPGEHPSSAPSICATVPVSLADDHEAAADAVRPYIALYVGGMGSRQQNFYTALATRLGFGEAAAHIQDLYLDGRHRDAAAAVPLELVDAVALIGDRARIADRVARYDGTGLGELSAQVMSPGGLAAQTATIETLASVWADLGWPTRP